MHFTTVARYIGCTAVRERKADWIRKVQLPKPSPLGRFERCKEGVNVKGGLHRFAIITLALASLICAAFRCISPDSQYLIAHGHRDGKVWGLRVTNGTVEFSDSTPAEPFFAKSTNDYTKIVADGVVRFAGCEYERHHVVLASDGSAHGTWWQASCDGWVVVFLLSCFPTLSFVFWCLARLRMARNRRRRGFLVEGLDLRL
jgi:hypothetical protein